MPWTDGDSRYETRVELRFDKNRLTYDDECLLVVYQRIYGKEYDCRSTSHIKMQNLAFLLGYSGIFERCGHSLGCHGLYSCTLERFLKFLDEKRNLVREFYEKPTSIHDLFTESAIRRIKQYNTEMWVIKKIIGEKEDADLVATILASSVRYIHEYNCPYCDLKKDAESLHEQFKNRVLALDSEKFSLICGVIALSELNRYQ